MTEHDDKEGMAAEYVLGTLPLQERREVAVMRVTDSELDREISYWEKKLAPLLETIAEAEPSTNLFSKIEERIDAVQKGSVVASGWRRLAIAASLAFVVVTGLLLYQLTSVPGAPRLIAALQSDKSTPVFVLGFDGKGNTLTVQTVNANPPPDKNYELWIVAEGTVPKSLGVVKPNGIASISLSLDNLSLVESATFAVSVEPVGGSPTGAPTGPVVYSGKLVKAI